MSLSVNLINADNRLTKITLTGRYMKNNYYYFFILSPVSIDLIKNYNNNLWEMDIFPCDINYSVDNNIYSVSTMSMFKYTPTQLSPRFSDNLSRLENNSM